jgi:ketosteroid isomerase-like protein
MTAPEHPNATRIAEFFAVMDAADDPEAAYAMLLDAFAEDAVWHHLGACHHAGTYRGRQAIIAEIMTSMIQDSGGTYAPTLLDVYAMGDELVVAHMSESAQIAGEHGEGHVAVTFKLVGGKIVEGVRMMDDSLDAHWAKAAPAGV